MSTINRVTKREKERIILESQLNHHIPKVLVDMLDSLKNIECRSILNVFKSGYSEAKFGTIEEEYTFIKDTICQLLDATFSNPFKEGMEKAMLLAIAETNFSSAARERFIHPFQAFLLGSIIIDKFYESFKKWFSEELCRSKNTDVEAAWLLASVFHDRSKPLMHLKKMIEYEEGEITTIEIPEKEEYVSVLSSLQTHLSRGKTLESWKPKRTRNILSQILLEYADADNHGVKSSFSLLRHLQKTFGKNAYNPGYVEAALAVALHDSQIHGPLLRNRIFPMDIALFPLPCLLLYCDAMEEWGRKTEYDPEVRLVEIKIEDNTVHCEVAFDQNERARSKIDETTGVMKCVRSKDIFFTFSPRIYVNL
jgi:hypothetical protein